MVAGLTAEAGLGPVYIPELTRWAVAATDRTRQSRPLGMLPIRYRELPSAPVHAFVERLTLRLADDGTELASDEVTFLMLPTVGMHTSSDSGLATDSGNHGGPTEELAERALTTVHIEM